MGKREYYTMRLVGREKLLPVFEISRKAQVWAKSWASEVSKSHWKSDSDVFKRFPNAKKEGSNLFIFRSQELQRGIEVKFAFLQGTALIHRVRKL